MIKKYYYFLLATVFFILSLFSIEAKSKPEVNAPIQNFTLGWYYPSINSLVSLTDFKIALKYWLQEFAEIVEFQSTEIKVFEDIETMQTAFKKGELSLIIVPPYLIVKHFDLNLLSDGFIGESINKQPYGVVILIRSDKNINQLSDFKNKRLALPEKSELARVLLDSLVIPQFKKSYTKIFKSIDLMKKQNAIIHSLFFNKTDVGVAYLETFNLMSELNPQIKNRIKILKNFPIASPNYSFFHKNFPENQRQLFIKELLKLNHTVRTQQILNNFRMSSIEKASVKSLEPFIQLNNQYKQLQLNNEY